MNIMELAYINKMMILIYIAIIGLLYTLFNEMEERSSKNKWEKWQSFLNSRQSWKRKYAPGLQPYVKKWYHFGIEPAYKERFPYSTTVLVFVTDGEHVFQFLKNIIILVGFLLIGWQLAIAWFTGTKIGSIIKEILKFD